MSLGRRAMASEAKNATACAAEPAKDLPQTHRQRLAKAREQRQGSHVMLLSAHLLAKASAVLPSRKLAER